VLLRPASRPAALPAVLLATLLLIVTACGGDEPKEGPLGKKSESPSASPTEPAATAPPVPRATDNEAGRKAFATWFVKALAYANATNDPKPITAVAANADKVTCSTCRAFATFLEDRERKGITLQPSTFDIQKMFNTGQIENNVIVFDAIVSHPASADVKEDGTVVKKYPPSDNYLIEVGIRFRDGAYEVAGWKTTEGKKS